MLSVESIDTYYGASHILQGVSLALAKGEAVAVLGRNGVGKTTLVRSIVGFTPPRRGRIVFEGEPISGLAPYKIIRRGIALVPQGRRMFGSLTVRESLAIAARAAPEKRGWTIEEAFAAFPRLKERTDVRAGRLSGGEQEMLAVARALVGNPKLVVLDEPSEGLSPIVVRDLEARLRTLKETGVSILLVEQQVAFALALADRVLVMSKGRIVFDGTPAALRGDAALRERYLGL